MQSGGGFNRLPEGFECVWNKQWDGTSFAGEELCLLVASQDLLSQPSARATAGATS